MPLNTSRTKVACSSSRLATMAAMELVTPTSTMLVVSATDEYDNKAGWSSYGTFVTLSAPGTNIWTTSTGWRYGQWNGTSFASPLAAGVAALVMSVNPSLSGAQVEKLLRDADHQLVDAAAKARVSLGGRGQGIVTEAIHCLDAKARGTVGPRIKLIGEFASANASLCEAFSAADGVYVGDHKISIRLRLPLEQWQPGSTIDFIQWRLPEQL